VNNTRPGGVIRATFLPSINSIDLSTCISSAVAPKYTLGGGTNLAGTQLAGIVSGSGAPGNANTNTWILGRYPVPNAYVTGVLISENFGSNEDGQSFIWESGHSLVIHCVFIYTIFILYVSASSYTFLMINIVNSKQVLEPDRDCGFKPGIFTNFCNFTWIFVCSNDGIHLHLHQYDHTDRFTRGKCDCGPECGV
jgi:hypothetical protein